jgi:hypothetical protein
MSDNLLFMIFTCSFIEIMFLLFIKVFLIEIEVNFVVYVVIIMIF